MPTITKNITLKLSSKEGRYTEFNLQVTQPSQGIVVHTVAFSKNSNTQGLTPRTQVTKTLRESQSSPVVSSPIALYNFNINDSEEKIARTVLRECACDQNFQEFFDKKSVQNKSVYVGEEYIGEIKLHEFQEHNFFECVREADFLYDTRDSVKQEASVRLMRSKVSGQETVFKVWSNYPDPKNNGSGVWVDVYGESDYLIKESDHNFLRAVLHPVVQGNQGSFYKGQVFYDEDGVRFSVTNSQLELESLRNPHRMAFWSGAAASVIGGVLIGLAVTGFVGSTFGIGGIALAALGLVVMIMAQVDKSCCQMRLFEASNRILGKVFNSADAKPANLMN